MSTDREGLLTRWSRLKAEAKSTPSDAPSETTEATASPARSSETSSGEPMTTPPKSEPVLADMDLDALDATSDYSKFMGSSVPADVRSKALRKLWTSDPMFSIHDGLDDCCGDYTDAQWAVGTIATAYRVGKGMLTDEEIAKWEQLGRPPVEIAEANARDETAEAPERASRVAAGETPAASGELTGIDVSPARVAEEHSEVEQPAEIRSVGTVAGAAAPPEPPKPS